jgi:1-deoxy-D-xylulose-5-phosphate reductoisomerase
VPIGYALAYPKRLQSFGDALGFPDCASDELDVLRMLGAKDGQAVLRYDFEPPDAARFPCIRLAYEALAAGGVAPAVLSAANEVAVAAFVEGKIAFGQIPEIIETTLNRVRPEEATLQGVRKADKAARRTAGEIVEVIERPTR